MSEWSCWALPYVTSAPLFRQWFACLHYTHLEIPGEVPLRCLQQAMWALFLLSWIIRIYFLKCWYIVSNMKQDSSNQNTRNHYTVWHHHKVYCLLLISKFFLKKKISASFRNFMKFYISPRTLAKRKPSMAQWKNCCFKTELHEQSSPSTAVEDVHKFLNEMKSSLCTQ